MGDISKNNGNVSCEDNKKNSGVQQHTACILLNRNHSTDLLFAAVSLLWDVNVQHAVLHLCLNLVSVGIVGEYECLLESGI